MTRGRVSTQTHGDYGYARKHNCTCDPCRRIVRRYHKQLEYDHSRGIRRRIDTGPVRDHVQTLLDGGATANQVARAAGMHRSMVTRLMFGNPQQGGKVPAYVFAPTAQKLLAVTLEQALAQDGMVPAVGTHRRLRALCARGYSVKELGAALGVTDSAVYDVLNRSTVTADVHRRVAAAYERLCMGEGSSEIMRWRAVRLGWAPPLAWDDATVDDPNAEPDREAMRCAVDHCGRKQDRDGVCRTHHRVVRELGGFRSSRHFRWAVLRLSTKRHQYNRDLLLEQVRDLRGTGLGPEAVAYRLGRGVEYVRKIWEEAS